MTDLTYSEAVERVARAIWDLRREEEDRCDMELEDMGKDHPVWAEARAAISTILDILREPTVPCIEAGAKAMVAGEGKEVDGADNWRALAAFRAMLAASPLHEEKV